MSEANCIADAKCLLGESPRWNAGDNLIYWSDIDGRKLWRVAEDGSALSHVELSQKAGCFVFAKSGGMILAMEDGIYEADPFNGGTDLRQICPHPDPEFAARGGRFNDGRCDGAGRLFVGTIDPGKTGCAALYMLEPGADKAALVQDGYNTFNGIAFHPNGTEVWYTDTPQRKLFRSSYDLATGKFGERETVCSWPALQEARPDGAAFDSRGNYYCAMYAGGQVLKVNPHGEVMADYRVPARYTTMAAFVGEKLDQMVVTSARRADDLEDITANVQAGGLFALDVDAAGISEPRFG